MGSLAALTFRRLISPFGPMLSLSSEFPLDTAGGGTIKIDFGLAAAAAAATPYRRSRPSRAVREPQYFCGKAHIMHNLYNKSYF